MLTLVKKMELSVTPNYLKERGLTISNFLNPIKLQENLSRLFSEVPDEYLPKQPVVLQQNQDKFNISYELERIPVKSDNNEITNFQLDVSGEADVEVLLDNAVFTVSDSLFCKKQTLTFVDTPVDFVREYLECQDCSFHIRQVNTYMFEVTIMPVMD